MKTTLAILVLALALKSEAKDFHTFVQVLNKVEARGQKKGVKPGDNGRALGPLQIHYKYWLDALEADPSIGGKYSDCNKWGYSVKVVRAYLSRHVPDALRSMDYKKMARVHNGGPTGHQTVATLSYWEDFKKKM
jgi:hypothetical protein